MLKYKAYHTLPQGGLDIGLKGGILAEIGYMLQECAVNEFVQMRYDFLQHWNEFILRWNLKLRNWDAKIVSKNHTI